MALNLLKPALRSKNIFMLRQAQSRFYMPYDDLITYPVWTTRRPTRIAEMLDGGSVFWIVNKYIRCRQEIVGFEKIAGDEDAKPEYMIYCDATLIETQPIEKRPFQGWRYLESSNAPHDVGAINSDESLPPAELAQELRDAGLL